MRRIRRTRRRPPALRGWLAAAVLLSSGLLADACSPAGTSTTISQEELAERLNGGQAPIILDVRTPREYQSGHVPGAVNVPISELAARVAELGDLKDREVVVYCELGSRSSRAQEWLMRNGFDRIRHLDGDMRGWRDSGLPVE